MRRVKIIDNVISPSYQNYIEQIFKSDFPWYFTEEISTPGDDPNSGFSHTIFNSEKKSPYFESVLPIVLQATDVNEVLRIRAGMFVRNQNDADHKKHIDLPDQKHYVMLYYISDSDGPTNIYHEDDVEQVHPKKGRAVIFPGEYYHSSSCPREYKTRMVLNYNFL